MAVWRVVIVLLATMVGFALTGIVIVRIVTAFVIPRVARGSRWSREVDSYMASLLGMAWTNAGRDDNVNTEEIAGPLKK